MSECSSGTCCRCGKGPDVCWLGAMSLGPHTLCMDCYYELSDEWGCDVDV